ncbi:autophagy protein 17 [Ptychographa xylographoides]|nr:autophagy protein 17 [Ptychographa xylographoides]
MASSTSSLLPEQTRSTTIPSLDVLVGHLLAAKRSLSCVEHVSRAHELVNKTRQSLEDQTILTARINFLHNGSSAQIDLLSHVLNHTHSIAKEGGSEFQTVIKVLDIAEAKLRQTLDQLRQTTVEPNLRPENEPRKSLVDFVDESGVDGLLSTIKQSIDATGEARKAYEDSNSGLEDDITRVREFLTLDDSNKGSTNLGHDLRSPIPDIIQHMEEHAQEMADNLESLVKHFDICVTAIKHTEGGGAAAQKITSDLPEGVATGLSSNDVPLEPLSEGERKEMLEVLEKDASEVEDVVMDIRDRGAEMEADFERVMAHSDHLFEMYARRTSAFKLLEETGERLPGYITQSHVFLLKWDEEKAKIEERMEELGSLTDFYDGFLNAYDNLIIEIGRRKNMEQKMVKVAHEAKTKIDRLYGEDQAERDAFKQELGDFLPVDIWPGLMMAPKRYKVSEEDEGVRSVPDISASVIQRAIRRIGGKRITA